MIQLRRLVFPKDYAQTTNQDAITIPSEAAALGLLFEYDPFMLKYR
jgi:hypothetical protein